MSSNLTHSHKLVVATLLAGFSTLVVTGALFAQEKPVEGVPLKRVILFNSGVGFFEHGGQVEGNESVELKFNVDDVNDLLKSMVLQDLGGGEISTVTYGSRDPITRTLKTFAVDLTENPTMSQLLGQIRGERVEVEAPNKIVGTILGVETRKRRVDEGEVVEQDVLNLLTQDGLRSVMLEQVTQIKILNEKLDNELKQALTVLAMGNSTDKKTVTLSFRGEGAREVRIGYIQETPVWKTSYRLVLDDDKPPYLQGWAIVENTTEADWKDVTLTMVSGRPISFQMDLYQPLYVQRPFVMQELYASLVPQTYGQDMERAEEAFRQLADRNKAMESRDGLAKAGEKQSSLRRSRELAPRAPQLAAAAKKRVATGGFGGGGFLQDEIDMTASVTSAANAVDVGDLFKYEIKTPVTLARQRSAMLPIVNSEVTGEKVSIYNERVHVKHPLNGLRLKNSTDLHIMQGPITVYDEGTYAGDARIEDLPPLAERLISYAMDLDTEVAPSSKSSPQQLTIVTIVKGTLHATRKYNRTKTYTVKNSSGRTKAVLIEQPLDADWKLLSPKEPTEKTRDLYRFAVKAEPGKPEKLVVEEERIERQAVNLTNVDDNTIRIYLNANVVSEKVKEALREVMKRKLELAQISNERRQLQQEIQVISQEQARIRQNMAQLDRNSDLYNRYVKKFGTQEDLVEEKQGKIKTLTEEETKLRKALDGFLAGLNLE